MERIDNRLPPPGAGRESGAYVRDHASTLPRVDGIVLAAGRSRRIGRSKPLLRVPLPPAGEAGEGAGGSGGQGRTGARRAGEGREAGVDETFIERAVTRLSRGGCRSVTVVVAAGDDPVRRLAHALGATVVENAEPDSQPIDSVRLGIASLPTDSAAIVVLPVDVPLVTTATVAAVIEAFAARRAPIVAPSYRGELGHPLLIARPLIRSVLTERLEQGLHSLLESHFDRIEDVPVNDPGTLIDIDTPEEYERLIARVDKFEML